MINYWKPLLIWWHPTKRATIRIIFINEGSHQQRHTKFCLFNTGVSFSFDEVRESSIIFDCMWDLIKQSHLNWNHYTVNMTNRFCNILISILFICVCSSSFFCVFKFNLFLSLKVINCCFWTLIISFCFGQTIDVCPRFGG